MIIARKICCCADEAGGIAASVFKQFLDAWSHKFNLSVYGICNLVSTAKCLVLKGHRSSLTNV